MHPKKRRRCERALERRENQLMRYLMNDFSDSKGNPLWRAGEPHEHRIIDIAQLEIANLKAKLGKA